MAQHERTESALTPEEWAAEDHRLERDGTVVFAPVGMAGLVVAFGSQAMHIPSAAMHATSALALQQSGPLDAPLFTWDDVDTIDEAISDAASEARPYPAGIQEATASLRSLRDRIAALLPPGDLARGRMM